MFVAIPTAIPPPPLTRRLGNLAGSTTRLDGVAVVGGREVDGVLVDLAQQLHRQRRQPRLGVVVDEPVGEEGVVVGLDLDRVDRLHTRVGTTALTRGVVVAAAHERRDHLLHLGQDSIWSRISRPVVLPALGAVDVVLRAATWATAPLGADVLREERHVVVRHRCGCAPGSVSSIGASRSCFAPEEADLALEEPRVAAVGRSSTLNSPLAKCDSAGDDPELEQQGLHVAGELRAVAWST